MIIGYAPIYHEKAFYFFGGGSNIDGNIALTKIARLDMKTTTWSVVGELKSPRVAHSVIYNGKVFLVVGGKNRHGTNNVNTKKKTERCNLHKGQMICVELGSTLENYVYYPILVTVDSNFTKNCV